MPDSSPANTRPIELVTENGFSILRSWEIDREPTTTAGNYYFLVRNPQGQEREIVFAIADDLVVQIELRSRRRILPGSSFWICCAERHLAIYLWENDDYPPGGPAPGQPVGSRRPDDGPSLGATGRNAEIVRMMETSFGGKARWPQRLSVYW